MRIVLVSLFMVACLTLSMAVCLDVFAVDMPSPSWRTKVPMPTARSQASVVAGDDGLIYVIGGYDGVNPPLDTVEAYDPLTDRWSTKASMVVGVRGAAATKGNDGLIYVFGGIASEKVATVQAYNRTSNSWSLRREMPLKLFEAGAAASNSSFIYVIGGESNLTSYSNHVLLYNSVLDYWYYTSEMPTGRSKLGVVKTPNGTIYAIGGYNGSTLSVVEAFNSLTRIWTRKAFLPSARLEFGVTVGSDNNLYVIGGGTQYLDNSPPFLDTTYVYCTNTDTWTEPSWSESALSMTRRGLGAALGVNNRIYAMGGSNGLSLNINEEGLVTLPGNKPPIAYIDYAGSNPTTIGSQVYFSGHGADVDGSIMSYRWSSSLDGLLSTQREFSSSSLRKGTHTIYFSVQDNSGAWSPQVTATLTIEEAATSDPLLQKISELNQSLNNLKQQNANMTNNLNSLKGMVDLMTWAILGTSIIILVLVVALISAIYYPPRPKPKAQ